MALRLSGRRLADAVMMARSVALECSLGGLAEAASSQLSMQTTKGIAEHMQQCNCLRCSLQQQPQHSWQAPSTSGRFPSLSMPSPRLFATNKNEAPGDATAENAAEASSTAGTGAEEPPSEPPSPDELLTQLQDKENSIQKLADQVEQLTDSLKRSLAEMENVRTRTAREVDSVKKFAVQNFIKSILDVPDNLERAYASVPADALEEGKDLDADKLKSLLKGLLEGVQATEKIMLQILKKNGVEQYNPINEKFDPNLHNALFEVPDPSKEPGTVAVVTKRGYKLHDRVVRPAEVGVVRAP